MSRSAGTTPRVRAAVELRFGSRALIAALAIAGSWLPPSPAQACGGFFCSANNPVNQAAERIVFAKNGDGTVTAVIEIQYQGPSESFSWLLPISSVPMGDQIAVASNVAFQRLQQATNPIYNLTTRVEGTCDSREERATNDSANAGGGLSAVPTPTLGGSVTVEATGVVGSFEWTVISLEESLTDPAAAAVEWLGENGYDVPSGAPGLLGPYLADGLYLLALRLQKGADVGSIRPIVLTYDAEKPMIPIKLTAVAANDDMGVLAWVLGEAQAVPQNYYKLELNEARINWFNAAANYNDVVTAAADDAGGQGFVTEMAGPTTSLAQVVWGQRDEAQWAELQQMAALNLDWFLQSVIAYSAWDGFWETVQAHVSYPTGTTLEQIRACPACNTSGPGPGFLAALEEQVIEPVRLVQDLIDAHPQVTRLYSTLSAPEMTIDPLFTFNASLPPVSNVHTAERVVECAAGYYFEEAPWRIELPSGGVVRGAPSTLNTWPATLDAQPANGRILRVGEQGGGNVVEDNTAVIQSALQSYNASVPTPHRRSSSGCSLTGQGGASGGNASGWAIVSLGLAALVRRRRLAS